LPLYREEAVNKILAEEVLNLRFLKRGGGTLGAMVMVMMMMMMVMAMGVVRGTVFNGDQHVSVFSGWDVGVFDATG
jgi:hypothetical protein